MKLSDIPGPLTEAEAGHLLGLASNLPDGQCAVVLGAGEGQAALHIASGLRLTGYGHCYALDNWSRRPPRVKTDFLERRNIYHFESLIAVCDGDPVEMVLNFRFPIIVGLLVIDWKVDVFDFLAAFTAWDKLVPPEGIMALNDQRLAFPHWGQLKSPDPAGRLTLYEKLHYKTPQDAKKLPENPGSQASAAAG